MFTLIERRFAIAAEPGENCGKYTAMLFKKKKSSMYDGEVEREYTRYITQTADTGARRNIDVFVSEILFMSTCVPGPYERYGFSSLTR